MERSDIRFYQVLLLVNTLIPLAVLLTRGLSGGLGANPIGEALAITGALALFFLLLTLAITPLRLLSGRPYLGKFRRLLGLMAFFYAALHFLSYSVLDQGLDLRFIAGDIFERPFIALGLFAFLFMIPLAATSTAGMIRRLGGKRWQQIHRRIYVLAIMGVLHYALLVKADLRWPLIAGSLLLVLLLLRLWPKLRTHTKVKVPAVGDSPR